MRFVAIIAVLIAHVLAGCAFERRFSIRPGENQVVRVSSGDRFSFEMEENGTTGYRWSCECDDSDVEVRINHVGPDCHDGTVGTAGKARVSIHVHRGYDGPSAVRFFYFRPWDKKDDFTKEFTVSLFKRIGDSAFWE